MMSLSIVPSRSGIWTAGHSKGRVSTTGAVTNEYILLCSSPLSLSITGSCGLNVTIGPWGGYSTSNTSLSVPMHTLFRMGFSGKATLASSGWYFLRAAAASIAKNNFDLYIHFTT